MTNLLFIVLFCLASLDARAQEFHFPPAAAQDDTVLSQSMLHSATQVMAVYHDDDREIYLDNLFRLQMVAGLYDKAAETIATLRQMRAPKIPGGGGWVNVQYEVFARAKAKEAADKLPLEEAYRRVFRERMGQLDDHTSFLVIRSMGAPWVGNAWRQDRANLVGGKGLSLTETVRLIHDYQASESYRQFTPLAKPLIEEDDEQRYIAAPAAPVKLPNGATICTVVTRPRNANRLPALLTFTIYAGPNILSLAKMAAAHGYAGVVGLTRGKQCSPDPVEPYGHDGADAAALIDWVAAQPWSDGRVGMYGGSYSGFTAWAAAKYMPKALKAIAVGAAAAPGLDVPMEGNVFWNFIYPWPFYTTDNKLLDDDTYGQYQRWNKLNHDWYVSGRAYRELEKIDGKPNPVFDEWISHPSYDAYWQHMIPYEKEFSRIQIPVLQTAGYYFGGPGAAVYYLSQHAKYNRNAEHYLLIGPYTHVGAQIGVVSLIGDVFPSLAGLGLDPVALLNLEELRYQFFDWVFKNAPRPELLKDKVNYEVTGANVWKHAPSFDAIANYRLRLYLDSAMAGKAYNLNEQSPASESFVTHSINFADRSDVDRPSQSGVLDKTLDTSNGIEFISQPLPTATEMSGLFSGRLDFVANKKDFDFEIDLYELTPKGEYVQLAPFWSRASYLGHPSWRQLLTPDKRERLDFQSIRLMSRQLQAGSRVVLVLRIIKEPSREINYGSGKYVSEETIQDAGVPLKVKWYNDAYIELPVSR